MYWVISGSFQVLKESAEGGNVIIGEIGPGELAGEMSFLDDCPRSATVMAKEDSEVLCIPHGKFMKVIHSQPKWFQSLMKVLSGRVRSTNEIIARK